ncbi:unnamed protein product [Vitrella brassicaformis CCMP3155]|uniref:subtilisin n=1 Tax=Vitrella brassicaformis (strain CCMP3155) TaxID=1169540 RepID=A0A0G4F3I1_VITBC|nr:unnamed protein product [Vitrella brassicaformis CCMP3155]|eukprot:CEM06389.1 unnamed protein product [Vitrella brassicaformis CCMP3155]
MQRLQVVLVLASLCCLGAYTPVPCVEEGVDYAPNDADADIRVETPISSPEACQRACEKETQCFFFTYDTQRKACFLKRLQEPRVEAAGLVSGTKACVKTHTAAVQEADLPTGVKHRGALSGALARLAEAVAFEEEGAVRPEGSKPYPFWGKGHVSREDRLSLEQRLMATRGPHHVRDRHVLVEVVPSAPPSEGEEGGGQMEELKQVLLDKGLKNATVARRLLTGWLPLEALKEVDSLKTVNSVRPALYRTNRGLVSAQGRKSMRADMLTKRLNVTGKNVKVGVVSDTYDNFCCGEHLTNAQQDIENDDLPADVDILMEGGYSLAGGSDEGRAMLQLIYDIASDAKLGFHTADGGTAVFAQGIRALAEWGADVIVDDIVYFTESFFQDGEVAQAATEVYKQGVAYFSAAGNMADESYESVFRDSGEEGQLGVLHDFDPSDGVTVYQPIKVPVGESWMAILNWDQAWFSVSGGEGSASDLDMIVYDAKKTPVYYLLAGGGDPNIGRDALEVTAFFNDGTIDVDGKPGPDTDFFLAIELHQGPAPGLMKYIMMEGEAPKEHFTFSSTIFGHCNAEGAIAVGAAEYSQTSPFNVTPAVIEPHSSVGPTNILFSPNGDRILDKRMKPELVGPDGVDTTFFIPDRDEDNTGFPNFYGTSAAAPQVAAVAALLLELEPGLTVDELYAALTESAQDMDNTATAKFDVGFDTRTGHGFIDAEKAADLAKQLMSERRGDGGYDAVSMQAGAGAEVATPPPGAAADVAAGDASGEEPSEELLNEVLEEKKRVDESVNRENKQDDQKRRRLMKKAGSHI